MNGIFLIIGGNMGNRYLHLTQCVEHLTQKVGLITLKSAIYQTKAWGKKDQQDFLNQVLFIESQYTAQEVLHKILSIEKEMGRIRDKKWEERIIDIDILFYNNDIIHEPNLTVPHPHLAERKFVLIPLCEIASNVTHPILHKSMQDLLLQCNDELEVTKYNTKH